MEVFEGRAWISGQGIIDTCIGVEDGKISSVKKTLKGDVHKKFEGVILPGAFDMHVHFRDPGYPNKEDWKSGSESAVCGGVTAVVDMPNTNPFTSNPETFDEKVSIASSKSIVDFGIGVNVEKGIATESWFDNISSAFWKLYPYGISSDEYFGLAREVLSKTSKPLVVHGEHPDHMHNSPLKSLSDHTDNRRTAEAECLSLMPSSENLHVAHLSTLEGLRRMPQHATSEVCPHHLLLNLENCDSLNCKVDPPLRTQKDNNGLYEAFRGAQIPILSSDHAPHTTAEKSSDSPPSGLPGVETMIPLMLNEVSENRLELSRLVNAMAESPANRLGLDRGQLTEGSPADFMVVDLSNKVPIKVENLHSRAGWTPYLDWPAIFPSHVYRRGELVCFDNNPIADNLGQHLF